MKRTKKKTAAHAATTPRPAKIVAAVKAVEMNVEKSVSSPLQLSLPLSLVKSNTTVLIISHLHYYLPVHTDTP